MLPPPPSCPSTCSAPGRCARSVRSGLTERHRRTRDGDSDDEDDAQVPSHPHTHTHTTPAPSTPQQSVLPSAFIPPPVGTEQNATQQLAALFAALIKQGGKVRCSSLEELNEALDDWFADAVRSGRTAAQLDSIRANQRLLIAQFAISDRMPPKQLLEYHRLWCKAVHTGTIDMFAHGAARNHTIFF